VSVATTAKEKTTPNFPPRLTLIGQKPFISTSFLYFARNKDFSITIHHGPIVPQGKKGHSTYPWSL
jgi:hypothetical protein